MFGRFFEVLWLFFENVGAKLRAYLESFVKGLRVSNLFQTLLDNDLQMMIIYVVIG